MKQKKAKSLSSYILFTQSFGWLAFLAILFFPVATFAKTAGEQRTQGASYDMAALYQQAFGKKIKRQASRQKPSSSSHKSQKVSSTRKQAKQYDLAALYSQTFGNKPSHSKKSKQQDSKQADFDLDALYAKAFGKKRVVKAAPSHVEVDLRVNKTTFGEVTVFSNSAGLINSVGTKSLLDILKDVLKEHIYKRIEKKIKEKKKVPFKTLTMMGMKANYNSVNLSLDLQINPALRKPRVLSMQYKKKAGVRDENKITADEISAFLNMYTTVGLNSEKNSKTNTKVKLEGSINIGNTVLESSGTFKNKKWDMGRTQLTYDKPDKLQRFVVGQISTGNRNFQENLELTGLRVSKEFFMKPELQITPKANQSFILDSESEVEVYINNQLRQRFYLEEGIYSLEDIGLYNGANNIRVKITDEFGKVTEKTSTQYYDSHLLKPNLSLFSLSVGYLSRQQAVKNKKLENKPILSGYYQRGITKNLTMSLDAQISPNSYLLGAEAITSVSFGSLKNSIAFSGGDDKSTGFATRFEFKPNIQRQLIGLDTLNEDMLRLDTKVGQFLDSWTISGEYRSEDFSMLNQDNALLLSGLDDEQHTNKKLKARIQTHFGLDLTNNWRGNLSLSAQDYYDNKSGYTANLAAIKRFNNGVRLSLGANYDSRDDFSVSLQVSIPLSREKGRRRKDFDILTSSKDKSIKSKFSVKPSSYVGKNSLAGSVEAIKRDKSNEQKLDLRYRHTNFETNLIARNQLDKNNNNTQQLNIGFNTSIACVGSKCASSYPVSDSFALVTGPSNQDRPIAVNNSQEKFYYSNENSRIPDNYATLINKKGSTAVVPLESYRYQNINIDESTLPNGYDAEKTEFEVFPRYHQGFIVKAGGEPATILSGELISAQHKPLGFKGGQWVPLKKNGKAIAFFSNKAGLFRVTSIPAGRYKLELFDYPDMSEIIINVPDKKGGVHDVGKLIVTE